MTEFDGKRWHDMGGDLSGAITGHAPNEDHDHAIWEKRVDALLVLCSGKGLFTVDGLRRGVEDLGLEAFETMTYYERWIVSINQNLVEAEVYTLAELGERMDQIKARGDTYGAAARHD